MNLQNISDQSLIQKTEIFIREEREVLTKLLHHFKEIERRRLYCDFKYSSLHKMLIGHFGYSDDEAYRRVAAMRLISELPEVETWINQGALSLSHLGLAQTFFRQEKKSQTGELSKESKLELLSQISMQPIREAQRIVLAKSSVPEQLRAEKTIIISENKTEYRFTANKSFDEKLNEIKGLLAHRHPILTMAELLEIICDLGIEKLKNEKNSATSMKQSANNSVASIRREVWQEGKYKCSNCNSKYAVEIDHRKPRGAGGKDTKENLRLLCRSCNQRAAIKHFGIKRMEHYLK